MLSPILLGFKSWKKSDTKGTDEIEGTYKGTFSISNSVEGSLRQLVDRMICQEGIECIPIDLCVFRIGIVLNE